jgi:hypothetical protein
MWPTLNPGAITILTSERPTDLRKGQIVAEHGNGLDLVDRAKSEAVAAVRRRVLPFAGGR